MRGTLHNQEMKMSTEKTQPNTEAPEAVTPPVEAAPEAPEAPEAPAEEPQAAKSKPNGKVTDPLLLGELLPQEVMAMQQVRGRVNQHLMEIGHFEVQKAMLLAKLEQLEVQGQGIIKQARLRLGIEDDVTIQVTPDGKIRRYPQMPQNVLKMPTPGGSPPQG